MNAATAQAELSPPGKLWNRSFVLWWLGAAQSNLGSSLSGIALSFLVLHQTGSSGAMGVTLALGLLPALLAPLMGTLTDRLPLKLPLTLSYGLRAAIQLGIGLAALHGQVPLWLLNTLTLVNGALLQVAAPSIMSALPRLVPEDQFVRASALMQSTTQIAQLLGLIGGGVLVSRLGSAPSLLLDGLSFAVFAVLLPFIALPRTGVSTSGGSFWADFRGGWQYLKSSLLFVMLPLLAFCINASLAPLDLLLPARMTALGTGAQGYGIFFALVSVGVLAFSLLAGILNDRLPLRAASVVGLTGIGISTLLLALTRSAPQMYAAAVLFGLTVGVTNTSIGALFARLIAPEYRGRVSSLMGAAGIIGTPLVLLALAPLANRLSLGTLLGVSGLVTLAAAGLWAYALYQTRGRAQGTLSERSGDPAASQRL